jgi:hypothetical protein
VSNVRATPKGAIVVSMVYVPKAIDERGYVVAVGEPQQLAAIVQACRGNDMIVLDLQHDDHRRGARTLRVKGSLVQAVE